MIRSGILSAGLQWVAAQKMAAWWKQGAPVVELKARRMALREL